MTASGIMLGTVQFGLAYGIANIHGKPSFETVCDIVETACDGGVRALDTAAAYGDSEAVLGRALARLGLRDKLEVVSKIPPIEAETDAQAAAFIERTLAASLRNLGLERLSACLLHREDDLRFLPLLEAMVGKGLIGEAGVSLDTARFIREGVTARCVQLPCNILDRRFDRFWPLARARGTRVFTRSVYLQGLLLMPEDKIRPSLAAVVSVRRKLADIARDAGLTLAELCMRFALSNPDISSVLVGVDTRTWRPFAWKLDPLSGAREKMEGAVYHASPDGRWLVSANMTTMRRTQPGYGVCIPLDAMRQNVGPSEDDGFYLTDTATGRTRLLASTADILAKADPPVRIDNPARQEIYGFHSKFNPQCDRLMLSLRWFPTAGEPRWNLFQYDHAAVRFAWMTTGLDGGAFACAVGPEQWEKGGHHATWFPDGKRISMNLNIDRDGLRFVQVDADGGDLHKMLDATPGSGHPTVHSDGRHLLTDAYKGERVAFGDGTIPLRWIDLASGREKVVARINVDTGCADGVLRVDPHPAWDRTWRYVTFNGFVGGTRRVFIADMRSLLV